MADEWTKVSDAPLFQEHVVLGGIFESDEPLLALPMRYGDGRGESEGLSDGCGLCDLSGMTLALVSGEGASAFMAAACAGVELAIGECTFGAVVSGDGSVANVPLVARTGDAEYLLADPTERGLGLVPWLNFLASIEQNGFRPFEGVHVEDVSTSLHPLLLWGPKARLVLSDYVSQDEALPEKGQVASVSLDRILSIVVAPSCDDEPCLLMLVPPIRARVLWRSLLSFTLVSPVGSDALKSHATDALGWLEHVMATGDASRLDHAALSAHGLVRSDGGYVGERALRAR